MANVDWYIEGVEVSNCNCDYACPCQFESARPTYGDCRGFAAVNIDKGHFGDVGLIDALVRADKPYDLVVLPEGHHLIQGPYWWRRVTDYLREHFQPEVQKARDRSR